MLLLERALSIERDWDVIIAGGGFAGLTAALILTEFGHRCLVLEAADQPGGAAAISAGIIWAPENVGKLTAYVPDGDSHLQRAYCETFPDAVGWLISRGLPLSELAPLGSLGTGTVMGPGRSGDRYEFMSLMSQKVELAGGAVAYRSPLMEATKSDGCYTVTAGGNIAASLRTRALILATGGFQANPKLLDRYVGLGSGSALMLRSVAECTGAGLLTALSLGASTSRNMGNVYGHTMPDMPVLISEMQPLTAYLARQSLILNRDGMRFVDESEGRLEEVNLQFGWAQPGGVYYLLFDNRVYREYGVDVGISSALPKLDRVARWRESATCVLQAGTLEELAFQLGYREGMNAAQALQTMRDYSIACTNGHADVLIPARRFDPIPLSEPPFFAVRAKGGVTATCGGVRVDAACRAVGGAGLVLPMLYACGVDAGGVFGKTYGGFLGWALASGVLAGRSAAADLKTA